jgi:hypothetical protein
MRSALPELRSVAQVAQPAPDERACPIDRACVRGAAAACATAGGHVGAIGPASAREDVEAIACSRATSRSTVAEHSRLADGDDASANATGRLEGRCEHTGLAITRTRDTGHSELANASAGSREGASTRASPSRTDATLATASLSSRRDSDAADDAQTRQPPRRLCPRGAHHTLSATKFSPRTCRTLRSAVAANARPARRSVRMHEVVHDGPSRQSEDQHEGLPCRARRACVASMLWCPRLQPAGTSQALARFSRRARRRHWPRFSRRARRRDWPASTDGHAEGIGPAPAGATSKSMTPRQPARTLKALLAVARRHRARSPSTRASPTAITRPRMRPAGPRGGASTRASRSRADATLATANSRMRQQAREEVRAHGPRDHAHTRHSPRRPVVAARPGRCR